MVGVIAGGMLGAFAGYRGGILDLILTRVLDVLIAFPC